MTHIEKHVEDGASVYTDSLHSYNHLGIYYNHGVVDHAECYARGEVHTNGLENFWSLFKRGIHGTYVSVEPFHLFRYLDEQAFRFNERSGNDADRFESVINGIVGRRLTYKELIGETSSERP
jgi:transposase-like protein